MEEHKTEETTNRKPKSKPVAVRVISTAGKAALVEWQDKTGFHRVTIPQAEVKDGAVDSAVLAAGIEYGCDWSTVSISVPSGAALKYELNRIGVWTAQDVRANAAQVTAVITKLLGLMRKDLIAAAEHKQEA